MTNRRDFLASGALLSLTMSDRALAAPASTDDGTPHLDLAMEIIVDIGETEDMGEGPLGHRRIVPILGGSFSGPRLRGKVRPGGADRQLIRSDGMHQLSALYELETDDGAVITVLNKVMVETLPDGARYAVSAPELTAPKGPHDWLNHAVFVGTLTSLKPARQAVKIRFFRVS
ncbi:DUF3237 domain-containing protein [Novosphingobium terrae]|uniref:DUF3237 domain-containing protein n=1 Tax=Novosphingobium terrae TaxID=2726189 RepID=UPI00197CD4A9|nr:DUF3237 domain-containing protein [Novosphingobium terrae]